MCPPTLVALRYSLIPSAIGLVILMYALMPSNTNVRSNTSSAEVHSNTKYYRPGNTDVPSNASSTEVRSTIGLVILMYLPSNASSTDDYALIQSTIGPVILTYALIPSTRPGNTEVRSNTSKVEAHLIVPSSTVPLCKKYSIVIYQRRSEY
jgi:hypothetical protein